MEAPGHQGCTVESRQAPFPGPGARTLQWSGGECESGRQSLSGPAAPAPPGGPCLGKPAASALSLCAGTLQE